MIREKVFLKLSRIGYPIFAKKLNPVSGTENLPRTGGYIVAANHVDWLDGFFIATMTGLARQVPVYFLSKSNNYWWTTVVVQIPKEPERIVNRAAKYLKQGRVIVNFPEGQRNNNKKLLPGKTGTIRMALAAGVPIVPIGISCSFGRNMGQSLMNLHSADHRVTIKIGRPLIISNPPGGPAKDWLVAETQRLMMAIAPLANKIV